MREFEGALLAQMDRIATAIERSAVAQEKASRLLAEILYSQHKGKPRECAASRGTRIEDFIHRSAAAGTLRGIGDKAWKIIRALRAGELVEFSGLPGPVVLATAEELAELYNKDHLRPRRNCLHIPGVGVATYTRLYEALVKAGVHSAP